MKTVEKLATLRSLMKSRNIDALIVPTADPHQSEYVAPHWQARQWITGFTGSAGTLVVTADKAGLWTDGRYFIQAAKELKGSGIPLFKAREPDVPAVNEWIAREVRPGQCVAFDGRLFSVEAVREMEKAFAGKMLTLRMREDLAGLIWADRPAAPREPAFDFPVKYAGQGRVKKLAAVRAQLVGKKADALLLGSLDDIAWLLNIRGNDIQHTPVVSAYVLVTGKAAVLFADPAKFSPALKRALRRDGVIIRPYGAVVSSLRALSPVTSLCYSPSRVNQWVGAAIPKAVRRMEVPVDITSELKAAKNPVERGHFHQAAVVDGVALVRFFAWLERCLAAGQAVTEFTAAERLQAFRREAPEYRDDSFNTICACRANAAMVHYSATAGAAADLGRRGLLLVDSGGNYFGGTMDTTRTVALGPVPVVARRDYTLVLKGLIALSRARFPAGTTGTHLDVLARAALWAGGVNYKHGSGHGVGSYLSVHEGPQGFKPVWNPCALTPGMVLTIEPGAYVEGRYGIRTENMVLVKGSGATVHGEFLEFETLTLCPIDTAPLTLELLEPSERRWLNDYHRQVWERLSPLLKTSDRDWLRRKTKPIGES